MCRVRGASAAEAPLRAQTPRSCRRAQVWLEGESSAELQAIAMTARGTAWSAASGRHPARVRRPAASSAWCMAGA